MTSEQLIEIADIVIQQLGFNKDETYKSLDFWKVTLLNCDFTKAQEAIRVLMINGGPRKQQPGPWFSAIANYCGTRVAEKPKPENPKVTGCEKCGNSGYIEVPSHKDFDNFSWNGRYTMVVACECGMGQMVACQTMNIRQYQEQFPNWQMEYPVRMYQHQLKCAMSQKPLCAEDRPKRNAKIAMLRAAISAAGVDPDGGM